MKTAPTAAFLGLAVSLQSAPSLVAGPPIAISSNMFQSTVLDRKVHYSVHLPAGEVPEGGWPLVILVHGMGRTHRTIADDADAAALVAACPYVIVFSDGHDYPGPQHARFKFMLLELLQLARTTLPVSPLPERTGICGWSMGGYTAVRFAEAFPAEVRSVASGIGVLDPVEPKQGDDAPQPTLDDPLAGAFSPLPHAERLRGHRILLASGAEDGYRLENRRMHARLSELGIGHQFVEVGGGHSFETVRKCLPLWFAFMETTLASRPAQKEHQNAPTH